MARSRKAFFLSPSPMKIKTALGFKLNALVFLGINADLSSSPQASVSAVIVQKVLILNTPTGFLRVRESNSLTSSEIAQVKPGESFELLEEDGNWFKIKLDSSIGKNNVGWISSSYAIKQ